MYPLAQNEVPDLYDFEKKYNNEFLSEFKEKHAEKILDISTYRITSYNVCYTKLLRMWK